ncbi:DUF4116 domain-containing protein [Legionella massiliensis]|nr:DUF4116 domain-containing protein [Legionella massiliensis]
MPGKKQFDLVKQATQDLVTVLGAAVMLTAALETPTLSADDKKLIKSAITCFERISSRAKTFLDTLKQASTNNEQEEINLLTNLVESDEFKSLVAEVYNFRPFYDNVFKVIPKLGLDQTDSKKIGSSTTGPAFYLMRLTNVFKEWEDVFKDWGKKVTEKEVTTDQLSDKHSKIRELARLRTIFVGLTHGADIGMDSEFVLTMLKDEPSLTPDSVVGFLNRCLDHLRQDRAFVLRQVAIDGMNLQFAPEQYKQDKEIFTIATNQNREAFKYGADKFQQEKKIFLKMVAEDGMLLEYAPPYLKNDQDVVGAAIFQNIKAWQYASDDLQAIRTKHLDKIRQGSNGNIDLAAFPEFLKKDKIIARFLTAHLAVYEDKQAERCIADERKNDKNFKLDAKFISQFSKQLDSLNDEAKHLQQLAEKFPHYKQSAEATTKLHETLKTSFESFLEKGAEGEKVFKTSCATAIAEARPQFKQNPRITDLLNGLEQIVRALIGEGELTDRLHRAANSHHTFFRSAAMVTADKLAATAKISPKQLDDLTPADKNELTSPQ